ncbi:MAG: calcium-binding protein, partial [Rhodovulum sp.]
PDWTSSHVFSLNDVTGGFDGATYATDPSIIDLTAPKDYKEGYTLYPVDSEFGFIVTDFFGTEDKVRDGVYTEGWAGNIDGGGLAVADAPTDSFKAPAKTGTWLAGLGNNSVKASTEHYVVMQNVLSDQYFPGGTLEDGSPAVYPLDNDLRIVDLRDPLDPEYSGYNGMLVTDAIAMAGDVNGDGVADIKDVLDPNEESVRYDIAVSDDYSVTLKDDGKLLYRWGNLVKRPNDIRLDVKLDLPDEFEEFDQATGARKLFKITQAELVTEHTITNNPNDQIRIEDYENEAAIGRLPGYTVDGDGNWVSDGDFYAGDGTFYPTGTVLRDVDLASSWAGSWAEAIGAEDWAAGFTNAYYTTLDREPFEPELNLAGDDYEVGPRWRLKAPKYGQDLPGVDIPLDPSTPPPYTTAELKYESGELTQTVLNILDWEAPFSPMSISAGFQSNANGVTSTSTLSVNGVNYTNDLDVAFYVKGDQKPVALYDTELVMSYEEITVNGVGATITGGAGEDYLVGQGDNAFTGGDSSDLFVVNYGKQLDIFLGGPASTITDFTIGEDVLGLFDFFVNEILDDEAGTTWRDAIDQDVVNGDLEISVWGYHAVTLEGVTSTLGYEDFLFLNPNVSLVGEFVVIGTPGDDVLTGSASTDLLLGLEGDDILDGGAGGDVLDGGEGFDTAAYNHADSGVQVDLSGTLTNTGEAAGDIFVSIERVVGSNFDDTLIGDDGDNILSGLLGDDTLVGGVGSDILYGNSGADVLAGGLGADDLFGGSGADTFRFDELQDSPVGGNDVIRDWEDGT